MSRRSIAERYERTLEHDADALAGLAPAALSPVHERTVDVLTAFMDMGDKLSTGETPAAIRTLMQVLKRCRPMLLEQLGSVPPDAIKGFVAEIRDQLQSIIDAPDESGVDSDSGATAARPA